MESILKLKSEDIYELSDLQADFVLELVEYSKKHEVNILELIKMTAQGLKHMTEDELGILILAMNVID